MNNISALSSAFILSLILTPFFKFVASWLNILDQPGRNKTHDHPTPLLGGAAVYISFITIAFLAMKTLNPMHKTLLIAGAAIFIFGLIDDIKSLSAVKRLVVQVVATIILLRGGICFTFLPNTTAGKIGEIVLTLIWIVGITNAFNYLDGLNGLATGVAIISATFFAVFAGMTGQPTLVYILMIFVGACAGFFPYNFFKGKIFLGNSGSMWIGFTLAGLAVIGDWAPANPIDLIIPILIFAVPIFDMVLTSINRIVDRKVKNMIDLFRYRGKDHFHHRLSRVGLKNKGSVFFIYLTSIMMGLNALLVQMSQDLRIAFIVMSVSVLFFMLILLLLTNRPYMIKRGKEG